MHLIDTIKTRGPAVLRAIAGLLLLLMVRLPWRVIKFLGRMSLWLVFWPLAMFRAHNRKADRRNAEIIAAIREQS